MHKPAAHASAHEIQSAFERNFPQDYIRRLNVRYIQGGEFPDAAILDVEGRELRLERDYLDGLWTIASNERSPRLLARIGDDQFGPTLIPVLQECQQRLCQD